MSVEPVRDPQSLAEVLEDRDLGRVFFKPCLDPCREETEPGQCVENGLLAVVYCALPLLIASRVLAGLGTVIFNSWAIGVGVLLIITAVIATIRRRRRDKDADCCPPASPNAPDDSTAPKDDQP